jgi:hypothetical protein
VLPFVLGFSTPLVILILNQFIEGIQAFLAESRALTRSHTLNGIRQTRLALMTIPCHLARLTTLRSHQRLTVILNYTAARPPDADRSSTIITIIRHLRRSGNQVCTCTTLRNQTRCLHGPRLIVMCRPNYQFL